MNVKRDFWITFGFFALVLTTAILTRGTVVGAIMAAGVAVYAAMLIMLAAIYLTFRASVEKVSQRV